jgi:UDP-glucose 4-epimerase
VAVGRSYLIVGAGLIGGELAVQLAGEGHEVSVVSRSFGRRLRQQLAERGLEVELIEASLPESLGVVGELADAFDGRHAVFFLAGASTPSLSAREPAASMTELLAPALATLEAARRGGCERVVLASSGGTVYGRVSQVPTPESHPTEPISLHGVSSLALERYADFYARVQALPTVVLRYSNVYGPGQQARHGQGVIAAWLDAIARGESPVLIGDGSERRDFIHAADAAAAASAALRAEPGVYNVGAGRSWALREVLDLIRTATGGEFEYKQRAGRPVDVPHTELDASRFREATGWRPAVGLEQGLAETWNWVRP